MIIKYWLYNKSIEGDYIKKVSKVFSKVDKIF